MLTHPTLPQFILDQESQYGGTGEFSDILIDIGVIGKVLSRAMNQAGLIDIMGEADAENSSGDTVQKLDVLSNTLCIDYLTKTGNFCAIASEEEEDIVPLESGKDSEYVIAFDPLDGSSNIDYNVSVGTIFSVHKRVSPVGTPGTVEDFLQSGRTQVAAGYILYGSSTMLVYSTGHGVHGFTLDQSLGEWLLSHPNITIPKACNIYSANEAYINTWSFGDRSFLESLKANNPSMTSRHIGSLVADIHRNLLKGGIYFRPYDNSETKAAKLRLNYELKPLAFIVEQAGGYTTNGQGSILDIVPESLHEKGIMIAGNEPEVKEYEKFVQ